MKLRKQKERTTVPIEPYLPEFNNGLYAESADWSRTPEASLDVQEMQEFFQTCINELPDDHRVSYILKDVEKLSEVKVAEILRISRQAAKNRVHRARLVIRKRMEDRFFRQELQESNISPEDVLKHGQRRPPTGNP